MSVLISHLSLVLSDAFVSCSRAESNAELGRSVSPAHPVGAEGKQVILVLTKSTEFTSRIKKALKLRDTFTVKTRNNLKTFKNGYFMFNLKSVMFIRLSFKHKTI